MLRRLLLVLCLGLAGLATVAAPAPAQTHDQARAVRDDIGLAGQPALQESLAVKQLLQLIIEGTKEAEAGTLTEAWVEAWSVRLDDGIAAMEALPARMEPMSDTEIQRRSQGGAQHAADLRRMNAIRATVLAASREADALAREARSEARKALAGDEAARVRVVDIGVIAGRVNTEVNIAAEDAYLGGLPPDGAARLLGEAIQANTRASLEFDRFFERRVNGAPLDAAGTASRIRAHVAEARRQARRVDPIIQDELRQLSGESSSLAIKVRALLKSFAPAVETELRIADLLERAAGRLEANPDDGGDDAWGLEPVGPLEQKRARDYVARFEMIARFREP